ncbi:aminotransferase class I/II-fold pyridoxal phosphate-dependent enzyme [Prosthecomicrobium pneumaticum]|uniref:aspartate transaminase n=1 Tax=Prosthecomicrobium pneumaticum TaxID=81895 RepID=A0A7W9L3Z4_9HYPH|nr:aminotransferase class I/II-fold pyridoxal phosphate-dependent enzyme [Prosthecomicrobium pneumaticum]MBB5755034.1 aspartate/methionine/tyrosine aminotransferase [Prosthecomicrobium pneumaticum]
MVKPGASRRSAIDPFIVMDVMTAAADREAAGARVVHMEVGEPGAAPPFAVREAARAALGGGRIGYTEALGARPLRQRIARYYAETHGVEVPIGRIAVTTGSSGAFNLSFLAAFDAGDRVALTAPGYPAYRNILKALGLVPVEIETHAADRHALTPEMLAAAHRAAPLAGVIIASPANPTGTMMTPEALAALVAAADDLGIRFVSDEIYHGLVYDGVAETALKLSPQAIVINSFSKYYCMTGWRVGWMVLPDDLVRPVERLAQNFYISAPDLSQRAAIAAFDATEELEAIKASYAANRLVLIDRLPSIGFEDIFPVDGAFYVYASVRRFSNDSAEFARRMLAEAGVAATPGLDFDQKRGHAFIRFSFAGTTADMVEAMDRIETWLR